MAQAHEQGLARALQALDAHWWQRHGAFWLLVTALTAWLFRFGIHLTPSARLAARDAGLLLVPHALITYGLLYAVLPELWRSQPRPAALALRLLGWLLLSLLLNYCFRYFVLVPLRQGSQTPFLEYHVIFATGPMMLVLPIAGAAACLRLYRQWQRQDLANARLREENYQAELQLLKAQVHPHFLFNTLNNLYALTLRQSAHAPEVVERLTGLLRFVVEQGNAPLIPLAEELALLRNYLALEQLRYGPRLELRFEAGPMPAGGRIAPLLLLPLVENAFKHGSAEQLGPASVRVALTVRGTSFNCLVVNSKSDNPAAPKAAGIGLHNVRQRLQLLYPRRHELTTTATADTFTAQLALELTPEPATPPRRQSGPASRPFHA